MHPAALLALALSVSFQEPELGLVHTPAACMSTEDYPLIEARARPGSAAAGKPLTLRFRGDDDAGWYEIEIPAGPGLTYQAAIPKPTLEAIRVHYYFATERPQVRSPDYVVSVLMGGCPEARSAPAELVERIRVRRTAEGQSPIPKGFSPEGIRPAGMSGTTVGILVGAAAGGGLAALAASGDDAATTPPVSSGPLRACFLPDPVPDIESGDTIVFDAACSEPASLTSYNWSFGDGATGQGSSIEHLYRPGGLYTVTLTVSDGSRSDSTSRIVNVIATPVACFITSPDPPRVRVNQAIEFNADCALGDRDGGPTFIESYVWDFGDSRTFGEGRVVTHLYDTPDIYGVTLIVTNDDGRQDRTTQFVVVERRTSGSTEVSFTSVLELPPGVNGQIALNDAETVTALSPSPQKHRLRGRGGENIVEGRLLSEGSEPGLWKFDFRGAADFVAGSLRVDSGDVVALDRESVVFRVTGKPGSPIRFRFRLQEASP
jgi:hypothetical protein